MAPYSYLMMRKAFRDFPQAEDILQDADPDVQVMFTGFVKQVKFQFSIMLLFGSVFMITFVALSAELPIMWNNIRGVNSLKPVGQLVPFIVAIGQLLNVIYQTMKRFAGGTVDDDDDDDDDDSMDGDIGTFCSKVYHSRVGYGIDNIDRPVSAEGWRRGSARG